MPEDRKVPGPHPCSQTGQSTVMVIAQGRIKGPTHRPAGQKHPAGILSMTRTLVWPIRHYRKPDTVCKEAPTQPALSGLSAAVGPYRGPRTSPTQIKLCQKQPLFNADGQITSTYSQTPSPQSPGHSKLISIQQSTRRPKSTTRILYLTVPNWGQ